METFWFWVFFNGFFDGLMEVFQTFHTVTFMRHLYHQFMLKGGITLILAVQRLLFVTEDKCSQHYPYPCVYENIGAKSNIKYSFRFQLLYIYSIQLFHPMVFITMF